ncbi:MAG: tetratricopeptide repeat protein [Chromatiales bacterium]|jgi:TolB-like protein/DNA-binding winged helix-turn-helix (wHTH) protein/Flp pilus assembly protein TadD
MSSDQAPENQQFLIGDWLFHADLHRLERENEIVKLEPRVAELLLFLAMKPGESISRSNLMDALWPNMVVGDEALSNAVNKLRKALGDDHHDPLFIETIPKVGYRLIAAVGLPEPSKSASVVVAESPPSEMSRFPAWRLPFVAVLTIAVISFYFIYQMYGPQVQEEIASQDVVYSLAVMPFESLGDDPVQLNLADGLTEDLITDFSRLSNMLVISGTSTNHYRGKDISPQTLAEELGVDFILKGNVRRIHEKIRVNAQLIDARNGYNRWAERYDKGVEEIFAVQNDVTNSILTAFDLKPPSQEMERVDRAATSNLLAYDYFLEGQRLSKIQTKESHEEARAAYRKAIDADPDYGRAYGALAYSMSVSYRRGWTDTPIETIDRAVQLGKQGVELDDSIPQTYWSLGFAYMMKRDFEKAEKALQDAIRIAPSYADGYGLLALIKNNRGEPEKAIEYIRKGMRLNPFFTWDYYYNLGRAYYTMGRYEEAIEYLLKAKERNENVIQVRLLLAASYVNVNRMDEAEWEIEEVQFLNPKETLTHTRQTIPMTNPAYLDKLISDLRKAGLPE